MSKPEPSEEELQAFIEDVEFLVKTLKEIFESSEASFYIDEENETLFVNLEGLEDYTQDEIAEIAMPVLEELDLDFEEIQLMPLKT